MNEVPITSGHVQLWITPSCSAINVSTGSLHVMPHKCNFINKWIATFVGLVVSCLHLTWLLIAFFANPSSKCSVSSDVNNILLLFVVAWTWRKIEHQRSHRSDLDVGTPGENNERVISPSRTSRLHERSLRDPVDQMQHFHGVTSTISGSIEEKV